MKQPLLNLNSSNQIRHLMSSISSQWKPFFILNNHNSSSQRVQYFLFIPCFEVIELEWFIYSETGVTFHELLIVWVVYCLQLTKTIHCSQHYLEPSWICMWFLHISQPTEVIRVFARKWCGGLFFPKLCFTAIPATTEKLQSMKRWERLAWKLETQQQSRAEQNRMIVIVIFGTYACQAVLCIAQNVGILDLADGVQVDEFTSHALFVSIPN